MPKKIYMGDKEYYEDDDGVIIAADVASKPAAAYNDLLSQASQRYANPAPLEFQEVRGQGVTPSQNTMQSQVAPTQYAQPPAPPEEEKYWTPQRYESLDNMLGGLHQIGTNLSRMGGHEAKITPAFGGYRGPVAANVNIGNQGLAQLMAMIAAKGGLR